MKKAVESGMPKQQIEASAARRQAMIDQGQEVIVGINKYKAKNAKPVDVREIENTGYVKQKFKRLNKPGKIVISKKLIPTECTY
ncbi:MAG: hypothetical protein CM1200mP28_17210 [Deltaproteobacteria bacterium]|nr:MAG: hypothetical protein CM1200mP28_17210 [Deltaproteobacteria bacterium]